MVCRVFLVLCYAVALCSQTPEVYVLLFHATNYTQTYSSQHYSIIDDVHIVHIALHINHTNKHTHKFTNFALFSQIHDVRLAHFAGFGNELVCSS